MDKFFMWKNTKFTQSMERSLYICRYPAFCFYLILSHLTIIQKEEKAFQGLGTGNRIATLMFYVSFTLKKENVR